MIHNKIKTFTPISSSTLRYLHRNKVTRLLLDRDQDVLTINICPELQNKLHIVALWHCGIVYSKDTVELSDHIICSQAKKLSYWRNG